MKCLVVDTDRQAMDWIAENLREREPIFDQWFSATSSKEAKEILGRETIDVLLLGLDLEFAGSDLILWMEKKKIPIVTVAMTRRREFAYAKLAIHMRLFDLVSIPLEGEELYSALFRAGEKAAQRRTFTVRMKMLEQSRRTELRTFWRDLYTGELENDIAAVAKYISDRSLDISPTSRFLSLLVGEEMRLRGDWIREHRQVRAKLRTYQENMSLLFGLKVSFIYISGRFLYGVAELPSGFEPDNVRILQECRKFIQALEYGEGLRLCCFFCNPCGILEVPGKMEQLQMLYHHYAMNNRVVDAEEVVQGTKDFVSEKDRSAPVAWVKKYINRHLDTEIHLSDLAEGIALNEDYLNRIFKKEEGMTVGQYIVGRKMDVAYWYLKNTSYPLTEIASLVGYLNYSSFYRTFKKETGKSPNQWREEQGGNAPGVTQ